MINLTITVFQYNIKSQIVNVGFYLVGWANLYVGKYCFVKFFSKPLVLTCPCVSRCQLSVEHRSLQCFLQSTDQWES